MCGFYLHTYDNIPTWRYYLHVYAQTHGSGGRDTRGIDPCEYGSPTQVGHEYITCRPIAIGFNLHVNILLVLCTTSAVGRICLTRRQVLHLTQYLPPYARTFYCIIL